MSANNNNNNNTSSSSSSRISGHGNAIVFFLNVTIGNHSLLFLQCPCKSRSKIAIATLTPMYSAFRCRTACMLLPRLGRAGKGLCHNESFVRSYGQVEVRLVKHQSTQKSNCYAVLDRLSLLNRCCTTKSIPHSPQHHVINERPR